MSDDGLLTVFFSPIAGLTQVKLTLPWSLV